MALATSKAYSSPFHDSFDVQTGDGSIGEDEFVAVNAMGEVSASDCKEAFNKMTNVSYTAVLLFVINRKFGLSMLPTDSESFH